MADHSYYDAEVEEEDDADTEEVLLLASRFASLKPGMKVAFVDHHPARDLHM